MEINKKISITFVSNYFDYIFDDCDMIMPELTVNEINDKIYEYVIIRDGYVFR